MDGENHFLFSDIAQKVKVEKVCSNALFRANAELLLWFCRCCIQTYMWLWPRSHMWTGIKKIQAAFSYHMGSNGAKQTWRLSAGFTAMFCTEKQNRRTESVDEVMAEKMEWAELIHENSSLCYQSDVITFVQQEGPHGHINDNLNSLTVKKNPSKTLKASIKLRMTYHG